MTIGTETKFSPPLKVLAGDAIARACRFNVTVRIHFNECNVDHGINPLH